MNSKMSPQISVLMPTRNAEPYLAEAVDSVFAQTFKDFELLVIDGASTDGTLKILQRYRDPRLRVLQAPASGIVPALNFGIEQARAPWIARQDADDVSLPDRFELQWKHLSQCPNSIFSHTDAELIGEGAATAGRSRFARTQALIALRLCWTCGIVHSSAMFQRQAALQVGGYQGQHAEDYSLWGRLIECGGLVGLPQKLVKFRLHPVSLSSRNREEMLKLTQLIAESHCQRFMRLSPEQAGRAHSILKAGTARSWKDWTWLLTKCLPRLRWQSAEMYSWVTLQTIKMLAPGCRR